MYRREKKGHRKSKSQEIDRAQNAKAQQRTKQTRQGKTWRQNTGKARKEQMDQATVSKARQTEEGEEK